MAHDWLQSFIDRGLISDDQLEEARVAGRRMGISPGEALVKLGCICDVLCNFIDADGNTVKHPLNQRTMSVDLDDLRRAGHVVIASGGSHRATAIIAAIRRIGCNTLVTDEGAARAMLDAAASGVRSS